MSIKRLKAKWWAWLVRRKAGQGAYDSALIYCERILSLYPKSRYAHSYIGESGLKLKPENADLWNNLGELYVKIGRYQDAVEANEKALQLQADLPDAHHALGLAHLKLGNTTAALAQCELLTPLDSAKASDLRDQIDSHRQI